MKVEFQLMTFLQAHKTLRTVVNEALNGSQKKTEQQPVQTLEEMVSVLGAAGGALFG